MFGLLALLLLILSLAAQQHNLLSGRYDAARLKTLLVPAAAWTPFPKITDREAWAKADPALLRGYYEKGLTFLNYEWPPIPATTSLLIERTGDRASFEAISFKKRQVLGTLVLAEIYENKGRFTDQIINGVWSICEESWWGASAHLPKSPAYKGLMDVTKPFVELFGAETATFLAWVDYFAGDKLDAVSPQVRKRIYYEVNRRVFEPLMTTPHGWMTSNANGRRPNNWNPWICSNWLNAVLLLEKDDTRRTAAVAKICQVLDEFVNPYPNDGGCDEGPGYWGAAAASLYDNIAMLNLASGDAFRYVFDDQKIKNMGRYIYRVQISPVYFVDFADASPKPGMAASMIYRFGKDIGDREMMQFGAYYRSPEPAGEARFHYFRLLFELFMQDEFKNAKAALPLPADAWFPDLQVMTARDHAGSTAGWFIAAKGGNNDESHNHNDVGNFIIYYDGQPLIIDVGSGTYTARTFSSHRYDIWFNCSDYHNLPDIGAEKEPAGPAYKATSVKYRGDKDAAGLSLDLAGAYPAKAGIKKFTRSVLLRRGKEVTVTDELAAGSAISVTEHFMTCYPVSAAKAGQLLIHYAPAEGPAKDFVLKYDAAQLKATVEKVPLTAMEDKGVRGNWGDNIYRVSLSALSPKSAAKFNFTVSKNK